MALTWMVVHVLQTLWALLYICSTVILQSSDKKEALSEGFVEC